MNSGNLDNDVGSFFKPMDSSLLSNRNYKNVQGWVIGVIVFLAVVLAILFFVLIIPHQTYKNTISDTQVIVRGTNVSLNSTDNKPDMPQAQKDAEELEVENVVLETGSTKELATKSPLLKSQRASVVEYHVKSGDTLERIAKQFYGQYSEEAINKIRGANSIRSARGLQVGQKLMIPM